MSPDDRAAIMQSAIEVRAMCDKLRLALADLRAEAARLRNNALLLREVSRLLRAERPRPAGIVL